MKKLPSAAVRRGFSLIYAMFAMVALSGLISLAVDYGRVQVVKSELRFRSLQELTDSLTGSGFTVEHVYGDWNKGPLLGTSRVMVFVARPE